MIAHRGDPPQHVEVAAQHRAGGEGADRAEGGREGDLEEREATPPRLVDDAGGDLVVDHLEPEAERCQASLVELGDEPALLGLLAAQPHPVGQHHPARVEPAARVRDLGAVDADNRPLTALLLADDQAQAEFLLVEQTSETQALIDHRG